ncbi:MAG: ATP synthase F0 subunit B [Candidatus Sulfotelmatobacter sp.]
MFLRTIVSVPHGESYDSGFKNMSFVKKIVRAGLLTWLLMSFAGATGSLRAQDQPATPQKQRQSSGATNQRGVGQQLVHEAREAAGEEKDETAEFKQSASVRLIAKWTGMSLQHAYWLSVLLNFVVIAAVIIWAARKYLPGMFSARTAAIQKAMQEAQKASEEARRRLAEIESRLMKLDVEIGMMRDAAEREAGAEEARIQAAVQEDARKMVESAQQEIAAAAKAARRELTAYAADLAVGLAQKQIHVDAATDQVLLRKFAGELGVSEASGPGKDGR